MEVKLTSTERYKPDLNNHSVRLAYGWKRPETAGITEAILRIIDQPEAL